MNFISNGQDLSAVFWEPVHSENWITDDVPFDQRYALPALPVQLIMYVQNQQIFEADLDIVNGHVEAFDSMDDLIADLHNSE